MHWARIVVSEAKRGKSSFVNAIVGSVNAGKSTFVNAMRVVRRVASRGSARAGQRRKR